MVIDVTSLKSGLIEKINLDDTIIFEDDDLIGTGILELKDVKVVGDIVIDSSRNLYINIDIDGIMVLPCSITLKPTDCKFSTHVEGIVDKLLEEINKKVKKSENNIDILPIIWENILMEIPMKVVSDDASLTKSEGDGWKLITDEENGKRVNPELQRLKDLFK